MALSPTSSRSSGGSTAVHTYQDFNGSPTTTVTNGGNANLAWYTSAVIGTSLVDLSNPSVPSVKAAGVYAVTVALAAVTDMSVSGFFEFVVQLDADGVDFAASQESRLATAAQSRPSSVQTVVAYIPLDGTIIVTMHNRDGSASVDFDMPSAWIQRLQ